MNDNGSLIEGTEAIPSTEWCCKWSALGSHGDGSRAAPEASWPEFESDPHLHVLPIVSAAIWMDSAAWIFRSDLFAVAHGGSVWRVVAVRVLSFSKTETSRRSLRMMLALKYVYVSLATDALEKWELTSLMWIISCRREQLSDSHPPLQELQPSQSISQMCVGSGLRRRQPFCPFLWAVVEALRVKGLILLSEPYVCQKIATITQETELRM